MGGALAARRRILVGSGLFAGALSAVLFVIGGLFFIEVSTVDLRYQLRGQQSVPSDLAVVAVDDVTFDRLLVGGETPRWPFARDLHAQVIDRLRADGARAIGYDVQFTEGFDGRLAREERELRDAVVRAGNVVLATTEVAPGGGTAVLGGDEQVARAKARVANAGFPLDLGSVARRMSHSIQGLETFGVAVAERASGRDVPAASMPDEMPWIDFLGPPGTIPTESFANVLVGAFDPGTFKDKLVIVGTSAPSLRDVHPVPISPNELMSGPELQANMVHTAQSGFGLDDLPAWFDIALIALMGMVVPVASLRWRPVAALGLGAALLVVYLVASQLAFNSGFVVVVVYPLLALLIGLLASAIVAYLGISFDRQRIRDLFGRFVPESVVDQAVAAADGVRLGGVERVCTVVFVDLRGFTTFAEQRDVAEVIRVLNCYLSTMSEAILDEGGTLVSYMGDGIMAVFGAPLEQEDHADRALRAVRQMAGPCLEGFNEWMRAEGLGEGFRIGVGVNTGPVMTGNVGSERRLEYTAIGDTTNTAARLEGMTKGSGHEAYVADSTRALLEDRAALVEVGELEVRGRSTRTRVWTL